MKRIILASNSPYRKALLERLGINFTCLNSNLDESILKEKIQDPQELTRQLALEKAKNIAKNHKEALVIGSDQVCHFKGQILGKTGNLEDSFKQLTYLQGHTHELITSYAIIDNNVEIVKTNITTLHMRELNDLQIKKYLSADNPIDCAGSYKLELNGISLFKKIETEDQTAIIGLPLLSLADDLISLGHTIPPY
ncbi:MAG: nucleoside triphosphate pyrophosphatase [Bacteriovoracaceae bacterium]|jgi:septum formation protein|nr:septum formation protein Maf [Halobacteriovoraceae bacterium]MDP7320026.1 nucleoside triphosphate pyrophosphatase [Bacteriovoracaceae bacterium]|tara:strand:- start:149 stop:733 length:585 start_codon:yes stop_codon:yes gene_type:complete